MTPLKIRASLTETAKKGGRDGEKTPRSRAERKMPVALREKMRCAPGPQVLRLSQE